jgi:hypothetical protein
MRAFLSSTFRDLVFERRFVARKLNELGIGVVSMENDFKNEFDWRRWSTNQAGQCELFISFFDERVGTQGNLLFGDHAFHSISRMEKDRARGAAIKLLEYKLQRPFPDQEALFTAVEKDEYLKTLVVADDRGHPSSGEQIEGMLRTGISIESVAELARRLESDTRVSWHESLLHGIRVLRRSYFDQNFSAWRRAFEDESFVASTHRLGLSWRLRTPALLCLIPLAALYYALPIAWAFGCTILLLTLAGLMTVAYRPSFVWVGTKTIMARGAFGRIVQRSTNEDFQLEARWGLLDDWTGLGALSVRFADGARVFVPLVNDPSAFVRDIRGG